MAAPFDVHFELAGWALFWAALEVTDPTADLVPLLRSSEELVRRDLSREGLAEVPEVAAMRRLFRAAGTDPTRYRPSSEALLRRVLRGEEVPSIHPLVDLANALSLRLAVPCCVMADGRSSPPYGLRAGQEGESYESLRGPFELAGRPLLVDSFGPCDTPITGNVRVKVEDDTVRGWLVAYLPAEVIDAGAAAQALGVLLRDGSGVACRWAAGVQ